MTNKMMTKTRPVTRSAGVTAATVARRLKAAGFPLSDRSNPNNWTTGFLCYRLGESPICCVQYWVDNQTYRNPECCRNAAQQKKAGLEFLRSCGYEINKHGYIECQAK